MSEGDQQGNYVALLGNLLFPLIAFAGLFLLFRRAGDGSGGGMGPMGGPMDFGACACRRGVTQGLRLRLPPFRRAGRSEPPTATASAATPPRPRLSPHPSALLRPSGRSKSKFQEIPETGVLFDQVAGCDTAKLELQARGRALGWAAGLAGLAAGWRRARRCVPRAAAGPQLRPPALLNPVN